MATEGSNNTPIDSDNAGASGKGQQGMTCVLFPRAERAQPEESNTVAHHDPILPEEGLSETWPPVPGDDGLEYPTLPSDIDEEIISLVTPMLALQSARKWRSGKRLDVGLTTQVPSRIAAQIQTYANIWTRYANINFNFVPFGRQADIRIRWHDSPQVHGWSCLGNDALTVPASFPTMGLWFNANSRENDVRGLVLHEFGHALACIHEHQSPASSIPWNESAVMAYFTQLGMTPEQIREAVLDRADAADHVASDFDRYSIMAYSIPGFLTNHQLVIPSNNVLSRVDMWMISQMYPGRRS
ncbi:hypothetical protein FRC09_010642 [Ceratobasidium sp. 395]|nr:hypothetical protein FRC09_010642 [Ceratobasidium sp. 395]